MPDLTPEQEKALIAVVTARTWSDGWERGLTDEQREDAAAYFLAGVKWAEAQRAPATGPGPTPTEGR